MRLSAIRPIERDYGPATSGANKAAPARSLLGTKESGGENRARPEGNAQTDKGETEEAGDGRRGLELPPFADRAAQAKCAQSISSSMVTV